MARKPKETPDERQERLRKQALHASRVRQQRLAARRKALEDGNPERAVAEEARLLREAERRKAREAVAEERRKGDEATARELRRIRQREAKVRDARAPPPRTGLDAAAWAEAKYPMRRVHAGFAPDGSPTYETERWTPVPYQAELLRIASLEPGERPVSVAVWKGSQIGYTQCLAILNCWALLERSARVLTVLPHEGKANEFYKDKYHELYLNVPELAQLVDTVEHRAFVQGKHKTFSATGASSNVDGGRTGGAYRSRAVDFQFLDELDDYPLLAEGHPFVLSRRALRNTGGLLVAGSSPTTAHGESQIEAAYADAETRFVFLMRCPRCGRLADLRWENRRIPGEGGKGPRAAGTEFCCGLEGCGEFWGWDEHRAAVMGGRYVEARLEPNRRDRGQAWYPVPVEGGRWIEGGRLNTGEPWPRKIGLAVHSLHSIWNDAWTEFAESWLAVRDDKQKMRTFHEQTLARPWVDHDRSLEPSAVRQMALAEHEVDDACRLAACAVDVQDGWLMANVWLFSASERGVLVARERFEGDVTRAGEGAWTALGGWLRRRPDFLGRPVRLVAVDIGYQPEAAIMSARALGFPNLYFVRGRRGWELPSYDRRTYHIRGRSHRIYNLGVDNLKAAAMQGLASGSYRILGTMPEEVEEELAAEFLEERYHLGRSQMLWRKQPGARNEAFDLLVYAIAATRIANYKNIPDLPLKADKVAPRRREVGGISY